jgi:ribosomal-protein-alanine N-acetyltransferase
MTALRPMRWWDIDQVERIESELFDGTAWSAAQFWGELAQGNRTYVVAVDDAGGVVGYAGLMAVAPAADIQTIAVDAGHQGRGIAKAMLAYLLDIAAECGCVEVLLEVRADNAPAISLYEGHGFEVIARRTSYYGPGQDALVMRRRPR